MMVTMLLSETCHRPTELRCRHYRGGGRSARQQVSPWRPGRRHKRRHRKPLDLQQSMAKASSPHSSPCGQPSLQKPAPPANSGPPSAYRLPARRHRSTASATQVVIGAVQARPGKGPEDMLVWKSASSSASSSCSAAEARIT